MKAREKGIWWVTVHKEIGGHDTKSSREKRLVWNGIDTKQANKTTIFSIFCETLGKWSGYRKSPDHCGCLTVSSLGTKMLWTCAFWLIWRIFGKAFHTHQVVIVPWAFLEIWGMSESGPEFNLMVYQVYLSYLIFCDQSPEWCFSNLSRHEHRLKDLSDHGFSGPSPVSGSGWCGWGLMICKSNRFSDDAYPVGLRELSQSLLEIPISVYGQMRLPFTEHLISHLCLLVTELPVEKRYWPWQLMWKKKRILPFHLSITGSHIMCKGRRQRATSVARQVLCFTP